MMKILLVGQDPSLPGGMAKYIGGLSSYLATVPEIEPHFFNETRVKSRSGMHSANVWTASRESGVSVAAFLKTLKRLRPDVTHLHMAHGLSVLEKSAMATLAAHRGVPAVVHLHGADLDVALAAMPAWRRRWLNRALAWPNHAVVLSERIKSLARQHLPGSRVTVIPNAVHLIAPPPPLELLPTFGFIGFMDGRKGECDLLHALARPETGSARLVLAGDGPNQPAAQALAGRLKLDRRVEFLGNIDGALKDHFFRRIDVLCLPSHAENLPIALLEAMGYGRPVITTPVGAIPEMITEGIQGWLTPPGDVDALAAALGDAAGHLEEISRRGRAAWQTVADRYTWERNGPSIVKLYRDVHSEHHGGRS